MVQAIATTVYRKAAGKGADSFLGRHIPALEKMLWGGTVMLIVDHIINGEVTWRFPFLTALNYEGGWSVILHELLTVGLPMSVVLTLVWAIWAAVKDSRAKASVSVK